MKPTDEQLAIQQHVRTSTASLAINALAGTGKSSTLELIAPDIAGDVLALAFNKKIADALKGRLPKHFKIQTLNGLGHSAWGKLVGKRLEMDFKKAARVCSAVLDAAPASMVGDIEPRVLVTLFNAARTLGLVPAGPRHIGVKRFLSDDQEGWDNVAEFAGLLEAPPALVDLARMALQASIEEAYKGIIDFTDQPYMASCFSGAFPRFSTVLLDEAQDVSALNMHMVRRVTKDRLILVGDKHQCHPPGTMVQITKRGAVPIEQLEIGMHVMSFNTNQGAFMGIRGMGYEITNVVSYDIDDELIVVKCGYRTVRMTKNHRCSVRIGLANLRGVYINYIMRQGRQYRTGYCLGAYQSAFGPALRARQENADAFWVVGVHKTEKEAWIQEKIIHAKYALPEMIFTCRNSPASTQEWIDAFWERLGDNSANGIAAIEGFGLDATLPFYGKSSELSDGHDESSNVGRLRGSFLIHAVNLIPEFMTMVVMVGDLSKLGKHSDFAQHPISVSREKYCGPVYGITVEPEKKCNKRLYVADGVVVHNSIYGFRGSYANSMETLAKQFNAVELPLTTCFRCSKAVIREAQRIVPAIRAAEGAQGGKVWSSGEAWGPFTFGHGDAVLCRNNAPLFKLGFMLLNARVPVRMQGKDIGARIEWLVNKADRAKALDRENLLGRLDEIIADMPDGRQESARDIAEVIEATPGVGTKEILANIKTLIAQDAADGITLSTIHAAKGLEWERVFFLDRWRLPSKFAETEEQLQQERNLEYVAVTRAKRELIMIDMPRKRKEEEEV